jgi:DNA-binding NarL/FixJ family response regulator
MNVRRSRLQKRTTRQAIEHTQEGERRAVALRLHDEIGKGLDASAVITDEVVLMLRRLSLALRSPGATRGESAHRLTVRQRQILKMIAEGRSTREMAALLHLSVKTIESHRANLMAHLGIREVAGLVMYAIRSGVIDIDRPARGKGD